MHRGWNSVRITCQQTKGEAMEYQMKYGISLTVTGKNDTMLRKRMENHYSKPKGFVGRSICLGIRHNNVYYGHIVFGSATLHLPGRNDFLGVVCKDDIQRIANNTFYNISSESKYPMRNFTTRVLIEAEKIVIALWREKYGSTLIGFETLVEQNETRTGDLYIKGGYVPVGTTKGFTCKRVGGVGSDEWSGIRVWNKDPENLRPKLVLCKKIIL